MQVFCSETTYKLISLLVVIKWLSVEAGLLLCFFAVFWNPLCCLFSSWWLFGAQWKPSHSSAEGIWQQSCPGERNSVLKMDWEQLDQAQRWQPLARAQLKPVTRGVPRDLGSSPVYVCINDLGHRVFPQQIAGELNSEEWLINQRGVLPSRGWRNRPAWTSSGSAVGMAKSCCWWRAISDTTVG